MFTRFIYRWLQTTFKVFLSILIIVASLADQALLTNALLAQNLPNTPNVTGSIIGFVTDVTDKPLQGILIKVFRQGYSDTSPVTMTTTDAGGNYQVSFLRTGIYHVSFSDPNEQYLPEYYNHTSVSSQAADISVAGNVITGINAKMLLGGAIAGSVVMFDGKAPDEATLDIEKRVDQIWQTVASYSTTNGKPFNYAINNLLPAIYALRVQAHYQGANYTTIYKDAVDLDHATPITVTSGMTVSGLNFVIGEAGNLISGTVTTADKQPLADIQVTAYISRTYGWQIERTTLTNLQGTYQMRALSPGQYILSFREPTGTYSEEYYPNTPILAQATPITLSAAASHQSQHRITLSWAYLWQTDHV